MEAILLSIFFFQQYLLSWALNFAQSYAEILQLTRNGDEI